MEREAGVAARVTVSLVSRDLSAFACYELERAQPDGQGVAGRATALQQCTVLSADPAAAPVRRDYADASALLPGHVLAAHDGMRAMIRCVAGVQSTRCGAMLERVMNGPGTACCVARAS